jgi:hypothetical protein
MTTFITIPATRGDVWIDPASVVSVEPAPATPRGAVITLANGRHHTTNLMPTEVLDLIEAAMHPTTETETR